LITFVLTVIAFIAFLVIEEIFMPGVTQTPKVETQEPVTPFTDDREEKEASPEYSPTYPGEEKEDPPEYSPTSPGWVIKTDSPEYTLPPPIPAVTETASTPVPATIINIPDDNLKKALNAVLGKSPGEDITDAELTNITYLNAERRGIADLTGIEHLVNLTSITLSENQISDISALSSLNNLALLTLGNNLVGDVSALSSLNNLTILDLRWNRVRNVSSLSSLAKLTVLELDGNKIKNVKPLASLNNLNELALRWNQIEDIQSLVKNEGLSEWDVIYLGGNLLSDASLNVYIPQLEERGVEISLDDRSR
jgi:Leucine-rich repeat (LRR) protein